MSLKVFKTIYEQIEILKSRGLIIEDETLAKEFLLKNNYYRISGYSLTLRANDKFSQAVSFQNIMEIYNFDKRLRAILLYHLETIETHFKSIYAYNFSMVNTGERYLNSSCFTDINKFIFLQTKIEKQKLKRITQEAYLKHFQNTNQTVPFWAYVDLMTISDISMMFSISKSDVQSKVCLEYNMISSELPPT